ncbi:hypothetical protein M409DRAFT_18292 [Zasmidium cellare ATCC 36951]|uniref:NAD-dependent epimerase/dehydratase domain-containing protein n=1 Tax=Zasmidium cellare ATCC 36951 TaxID=1080233 RepID=A0A6A6CVV7_ZASCE|nr:uncharacterized protein M409DRAFT_18292 [Zasmidium cellare ATCC 36951]KAF2171175.1 hypothetical protein M409DRAFT_18292 [Zasmidium cellare ATCC 36951]
MATQKPLILVTGASGFIGSHTVNNFLRHGYRVCLAGRNESTCKRLLKTHAAHSTQLETTVVPDITVPGAFDTAVKGVSGVIHMASPFTYAIQDNERDLIIPAVKGAEGILQSTYRFAPDVKRVVLPSSFAALNDFGKGLRPGHVYDETQWNPITYQETKEDTKGLAYAGSKTLAERAAWEFLSSNPDVNFSLSTINPVMVYGSPLPGSLTLDHLGQSAGEIYALMNGTLDDVPPTRMPVFVDVRDVADAHRLAFETTQPGRFAMCGGDFTREEICRLFRDAGLGLEGRVPKNGVDRDTRVEHYRVDTTRAKEILGIKFKGFEETFLDMANEFLAMEESTK